jgi:hypothetical protein
MYSSTIALDWHRPDNTANLFTAVSREADPHVFRVTMELYDSIYPNFLQEALEQTLPYFKAFDVKFKSHLFSSVFEAQYLYPQVEEDVGHPCRFFCNKNENSFWFRVLYDGSKIHLEVSHALTDGTGAIYFLKAIGYRYIQLAYKSELTTWQQEKRYGMEYGMNVTDGYAVNYKRVKRTEHREPQAYVIKGQRRSIGDMGILTVNMSVSQIKEVSNTYKATISEYIAAVLLTAVRDTYPDNTKKPICIELPVNLRPLFKTETSLNFFSNISISLKQEEFSYSFKEILDCVIKQFKENVRKERFEQRFGFTVWGERCLIARMTPVVAKHWFLRRMYELCSGNHTIGFSNIGKIDLEPEFAPYVQEISAFATPTPYVPVKIAVCSVKDNFTVNITTKISDNTLPDKVVQVLEESGIMVQSFKHGRNECKAKSNGIKRHRFHSSKE